MFKPRESASVGRRAVVHVAEQRLRASSSSVLRRRRRRRKRAKEEEEEEEKETKRGSAGGGFIGESVDVRAWNEALFRRRRS